MSLPIRSKLDAFNILVNNETYLCLNKGFLFIANVFAQIEIIDNVIILDMWYSDFLSEVNFFITVHPAIYFFIVILMCYNDKLNFF